PAGEPLDILVNGCLVARGEVVVVNDRFGVRIVEIVSPEERIKRLR
ncbi:MAG: flagellar motor switch protein FliN, partial [Lysobacterales bacterium]